MKPRSFDFYIKLYVKKRKFRKHLKEKSKRKIKKFPEYN